MAVTADTVQVRLEAQTSSYIEAIRRADREFNSASISAEKAAARTNKALSEVGKGLEVSATAAALRDQNLALAETIRAEQALEGARLSAQISETGRAQSLQRSAQLAREYQSAVQLVATSERELSAAQEAVARSSANAARAIATQQQEMARLAAASQTAFNSNAGISLPSGDSTQRAADVAAYGQELDSLRAKFNPVYAAQQRYEASVESISRAQKVGAISANEATAAITREAAAMRSAIVAANALDDAIASGAKSSSFNTANIAAQFQDIGVTAAMGMSPLQIALQQGTQLSAVLNESVSRGVSPVRALGAAFAQIVNPISLATIALIALGTSAIQYFSTLASEGQPSEEILKKQNDRIRDVADRWGEAVPALRAYVDQLERAANQSDLEAATSDAISMQFESLRSQLPNLRAELAAARIDIEAVGGTSGEIDALQSAFDAFARKVEEGTATSADLDAILKILNGTTGSGTVPTMVQLASVLGGVAAALATAARNAQSFRDDLVNLNAARIRANAQEGFATREFVAEQLRLNSLTADQLALENEVARVKAEALRKGATALTDAQALAIATDNLAAAERRRAEAAAGRSGTKGVSDRERELQAVVDLIEELEYEYSILGLSNAEKAVANALRQAGAAATEEQRAQIESLVTATLSEKEAIDELNKSSQEWADTIQSATRGFIDDLIAGKDAAEAFSNVLSNIANKLIDVGLNSLFGGSGFNLAGLFSRGLPTRAMGGNVYAGQPTMINERGQEIFIPTQPGRMVPASQVNGGGSVVFAPNIDARGADVAAVARLEQSLQRLAAEVVPTIRKEIANGPKKGRR